MAEQSNLPRSTLLPPTPVISGMTSEQVIEIIKALREPSDEEKAKKAAEAAQRKEQASQAVAMAEQDLNNRMGLQQMCNHRNERYHTFVGQNCGDGNSVALCQICRKDYKWRTTPDQARQGINLLEYRGLTEAHLLAWEKQFPAEGSPPDRIKLITRAGKTP
jgi:hypothetical protein